MKTPSFSVSSVLERIIELGPSGRHKRKLVQDVALEDYNIRDYVKTAEHVLFIGTVIPKHKSARPYRVFVAQTPEESRVLKNGIILGEVFLPYKNLHLPIAGAYFEASKSNTGRVVEEVKVYALDGKDVSSRAEALVIDPKQRVSSQDLSDFLGSLQGSSARYTFFRQANNLWEGEGVHESPEVGQYGFKLMLRSQDGFHKFT